MIASLMSKTHITAPAVEREPVKQQQQQPAVVPETSPAQAAPTAAAPVHSKLMSLGRGLRRKSISEKISPVQEAATGSAEPPAEEQVADAAEPAPATKKSSLVSSDNSKSAGAATTISSIEKAVEELKVEQILRQSPVRRVGEVGEPANFGTNYIKLKCKNQGVYQYVVHFDPPVDNQMSRIKLLYHASEVTGSVRLFDGHTLFLPVLLKDKVTTIKAKAKQDTKEVTLRIQLTKILPPQQIPPTVFNIIFKKYLVVACC